MVDHVDGRILQLVEVDMVGLQPLQALVHDAAYIIRFKYSLAAVRTGHDVAALGGEDDFVTSAFERITEQRLCVAGAIGIRSIDEVHAEVESGFDGTERLGVLHWPEMPGMNHGAEADDTDAQTCFPE